MNQGSITYSSKQKKPGKTKAFFICLLIAAFLWLIHSLNTVYTYTLKVPVSFKNLPQNKKPLVQIPEKLTIDVKASGLKLALILLSKPLQELEIDFNTLKSTNRNQNFILSSSHLNFKNILKFETTVKHISPDTLYFSDKTGIQKNLPIKTPFYLKCKEGFGYKRPVTKPEFITVWGDSAVMKQLDTIYTQALNLNNLDKSVNKSLELIKPHPGIYISANEVNVNIEVERLIEQQVSLPIKDLYGGQKQSLSIFPSRVKVRFTSIQNAFNPADTALFQAMVDSRRMNKVSNKFPVFLGTLPGHVTVMSIEPKEVEVLIFKKP